MNELHAPIVRVTVQEDRAFVRRLARLEVPAGRSRWRLAEISPVLVDKSLAVTGPVQVLSARVARSRPTPAEREKPPLKPSTVASELLAQEADDVARLYRELLAAIAEQAAWGVGDTEEWDRQLEELEAWKETVVERQLALLPVARPYALASASSRQQAAHLTLELQAGEAGPVQLQLEYCVALATWRPYHQAEWTGAKVRLQAEGCVWQQTGEDWKEVELILSTERPGLGTTSPQLPQDRLLTRKRNGPLILQERELDVPTWEGPPPDEIPGIDDGGQPFTTTVAGPCTVASDGLPVRVPLFVLEEAAQLENLAVAQSCRPVLQRTRLRNSAPWPILAGPVDLIRESGWSGRTRLGLVAPGEAFTLGWGPHPALRTYREERQEPDVKDDLLGGWTRTRYEVRLAVANLSDRTETVHVLECVPVSEIKQVEVLVQSPAQADADGFVRWQLEVGPHARERLTLAYSVRKRKEVVH